MEFFQLPLPEPPALFLPTAIKAIIAATSPYSCTNTTVANTPIGLSGTETSRDSEFILQDNTSGSTDNKNVMEGTNGRGKTDMDTNGSSIIIVEQASSAKNHIYYSDSE